MRLSSALALLTLGTTFPLGNAFANPNAPKSFLSNKSSAAQGKSSIAFLSASVTARGGARAPTSISATAEGTTMEAKVAEHISQDNWDLLSERGQTSLANLIKSDADVGAQTHVYANWPEIGTDDEGKQQLADQVSEKIRSGEKKAIASAVYLFIYLFIYVFYTCSKTIDCILVFLFLTSQSIEIACRFGCILSRRSPNVPLQGTCTPERISRRLQPFR